MFSPWSLSKAESRLILTWGFGFHSSFCVYWSENVCFPTICFRSTFTRHNRQPNYTDLSSFIFLTQGRIWRQQWSCLRGPVIPVGISAMLLAFPCWSQDSAVGSCHTCFTVGLMRKTGLCLSQNWAWEGTHTKWWELQGPGNSWKRRGGCGVLESNLGAPSAPLFFSLQTHCLKEADPFPNA